VAVIIVQSPIFPDIKSKRAILMKANIKPILKPYCFVKGICIASIGSILGGRNGIKRNTKESIHPIKNLIQLPEADEMTDIEIYVSLLVSKQ
jgi:hypothetical protein